MSPIIDLQRRMTEVGRLRMGHQVAAGNSRRPAKLDHWRVTSRDRNRLEAIARLYGGEVKPWDERDGEFEVYTTVSELPILVMPGQTISQWWELWSGGGCVRRCDGEREMKTEFEDVPCICDTEKGDRKCKPTTRLSVMLPDVPGFGVYRLESHGIYAAIELAGTAALLESATRNGSYLPARLRIDQRSKVDGGKTTRWSVPTIDIDIPAREALGASIGAAPQVERGYTPLTLTAGVTLDEGLAAVNREAEPKTGNGRQQAPIGPVDEDIFGAPTEPIPVDEQPEVSDVQMITKRQRDLLWATVGDAEIPDEVLRDIVNEVTGQTSTKLIPRSRFDQVLEQVLHLDSLALTAEILRIAKARGSADEATERIVAHREQHTLAEHVAWLRSQRDRAVTVTGEVTS